MKQLFALLRSILGKVTPLAASKTLSLLLIHEAASVTGLSILSFKRDADGKATGEPIGRASLGIADAQGIVQSARRRADKGMERYQERMNEDDDLYGARCLCHSFAMAAAWSEIASAVQAELGLTDISCDGLSVPERYGVVTDHATGRVAIVVPGTPLPDWVNPEVAERVLAELNGEEAKSDPGPGLNLVRGDGSRVFIGINDPIPDWVQPDQVEWLKTELEARRLEHEAAQVLGRTPTDKDRMFMVPGGEC